MQTDSDAANACPGIVCKAADAGPQGICVDPMNDAKNCGGCGTVCAGGAPCQGGMCMCPGVEQSCGTGETATCVYTNSDNANCGACGTTCATNASCVNSTCECPTGQKVCGSGPGDSGTGGACADLNTDGNNCGVCGATCGLTATCNGGTCAPCGSLPTQIMCGASGRCVDKTTDPMNCGMCGATCLATEICSKGLCICPAGETLCGADAGAAATCYDLSVDQNNCGACGKACTGGMVCNGGNCVCPAGTHSCGSGAATKCLSNTSTSSCGLSSCSVCPIPTNGKSTCDGMSCGGTCQNGPYPTLCPPDGGPGLACVNLATDSTHCGACATPCSTKNATETCTASTCSIKSCNTGYADCDKSAADGCEIETTNDTNNCGSCTHACSATGANEVCTNSACMVSTCKVAGTANCDNNAANGCETNITSDAKNCGGCGEACNTNNATATCASSKCSVACNAGYANCDNNAANGCEIETTNDTSNCGGCGTVCSQAGGTGTCVGSTCKITCDSAHADCDKKVANGCETDITKTSNCGACGNTCSTVDVTEVCSSVSGGGYACSVSTCTAGFGDCDHNAANGCETNTNTSTANCGGCGFACSTNGGAVESCVKGVCSSVMCPNPDFADCNGIASDGCETNITTTTHCGDCNTSCGTANGTASCTGTGGVFSCSIACNKGYADCDGKNANGCEIETSNDSKNCGACGNMCPAGSTCQGGACACTGASSESCGNCGTGTQTRTCNAGTWSAWSACSGDGACAPAATQTCDTNGSQTCSTACQWGACVCNAGYSLCGTTCVNEQTDNMNCGACGNMCSSGSTCQSGACPCTGASSQSCGNCGMQTRTCNGGSWSVWSACSGTGVCAVGAMQTCDTNGSQTCSSACQWGACACNTGYSLCGTACVDEQTDNMNCGACSTTCPALSTCQGGACVCTGASSQACGNCGMQTRTCNAGTWSAWSACSGTGVCAVGAMQTCDTNGSQTCSSACQWGACACNAGYSLCGTACVDEQTDNMNCGACSTTCPALSTCQGGACACTGASSQACGNCGMQTRTCNAGTWSAWSACSGTGVCAVGAMQTCDTNGSQTCSSACQWGACACTTGYSLCGTACVDEQTDNMNCGACSSPCTAPTTACTAGKCACPSTTPNLCNGTCVDFTSDPNNCGSCGNSCEGGTCTGGGCS